MSFFKDYNTLDLTESILIPVRIVLFHKNDRLRQSILIIAFEATAFFRDISDESAEKLREYIKSARDEREAAKGGFRKMKGTKAENVHLPRRVG